MTLSDYFEHFGAPLANVRWSWGAQRPDGAVFLRVWQDGSVRKDGKLFVQLTHLQKYGDGRGQDKLGYSERLHHVELIRQGAKVYMVMCLAVDPDASPRQVKSFNAKELFVGGELETIGGETWVAVAKRVPYASVV